MRIVLDTNVLISGIFWPGKPHSLLELWMEDILELLVNREILTEYISVVHRLGKRCRRPDLANLWCGLIFQNVIIIEAPLAFTECRDPDDNKFIDCAIAGEVKLIISGDEDLLALKQVDDIKIMTPDEALHTLHQTPNIKH